MVVPTPPRIAPVAPEDPQTSLLGGEFDQRSLSDDFHRIFDIVWKRKWIVALFLAATVAGTTVYTLRQPKIFRATAALVIDRSTPQVLSGIKEVVQLGAGGYWGLRQYFKTQYEILKSRRLAQVVVERYDLDADPHFLGTEGSEGPEGSEVADPKGQSAVADPAGILVSRIQVEPLEESFIVYIHVEDTDPDYAARLANAVATTYREENGANRRRVLQGAQGDLGRLVTRLRKDKEAAQSGLLDYERENNVGTLGNRRKGVNIRLELLTKRVAEVSVDLASTRAALSELKHFEKTDDIFSISYAGLLKSKTIQTLKAQAIRLRADLANLRPRYLDQHPAIVQLKAHIADVERLAIREVRNQIKAVKHKVRELGRVARELKQSIADLRGDEIDLAAKELQHSWLKQRAEEAKEVYDKLSRRLLETQISEEVDSNNVWLLDEARAPAGPVRPRVKLNIMIGAFFGLLGGILFAFLFELADNSVKSDRDVEQIIRVPVLGVVPVVQDNDKRSPDSATKLDLPDPALLVYHRPKSQAAEFCRSIRTNLMFMSPERPLRALQITSANPREGKTTVSVSVAITMATSGSRTVLVDTDMRRPRVHRVFGMTNDSGMSSALIGTGSALPFCRDTGIPNLRVLPCGPIPPNPAELLHTRRFQEILAELKEEFDYAIFDSPPVLAVTDALVIGKHVDGVLMVVRIGETSKGAVVQAKRRMDAIGVRLFGCVLNHVDAERKDYRYYYYYGGKYYYGDEHSADA